jgi:hypothetical protein
MIKSLPGKHFSIDYKYRNPRFGGRSQYNTTQQKHTETPRPNTIQQHNKNIQKRQEPIQYNSTTKHTETSRPNTIQQHNKNIQKRQNPIQYNNTTKTYRNVKTQYNTTTQQKHTETSRPNTIQQHNKNIQKRQNPI